MKEPIFKILVILLSPTHFVLWIFAKLLEFAIEIGRPIATTLPKKVKEAESFWKEIFKRKTNKRYGGSK